VNNNSWLATTTKPIGAREKLFISSRWLATIFGWQQHTAAVVRQLKTFKFIIQ
jgi:hypothetical protein